MRKLIAILLVLCLTMSTTGVFANGSLVTEHNGVRVQIIKDNEVERVVVTEDANGVYKAVFNKKTLNATVTAVSLKNIDKRMNEEVEGYSIDLTKEQLNDLRTFTTTKTDSKKETQIIRASSSTIRENEFYFPEGGTKERFSYKFLANGKRIAQHDGEIKGGYISNISNEMKDIVDTYADNVDDMCDNASTIDSGTWGAAAAVVAFLSGGSWALLAAFLWAVGAGQGLFDAGEAFDKARSYANSNFALISFN